MSQENVEIVRAFMEAFNAGDIEGVIACCDPGIEFHSTFAAVGGASYHGHDGVRTWYRDLEEEWGDIRSEVEVLYDVGEHTLTLTVFRGRGKHSGAEAALPAAVVTRAEDGLIVYFKGYAHREDALSDLGVSKDALEPLEP
jgi:ketosteroid isomerase-like protein